MKFWGYLMGTLRLPNGGPKGPQLVAEGHQPSAGARSLAPIGGWTFLATWIISGIHYIVLTPYDKLTIWGSKSDCFSDMLHSLGLQLDCKLHTAHTHPHILIIKPLQSTKYTANCTLHTLIHTYWWWKANCVSITTAFFLGQILQESNEGRRPGIKIKIKIKIKSYINC